MAPLANLTGIMLRSSIDAGVALVRTVYWVSADFRRSRRQRQVLGIDRIHDVERRQSPGQKLVRVDVHHDLTIFAARRRRQRDAGNRRQLLPDAVNAEVVELPARSGYPN